MNIYSAAVLLFSFGVFLMAIFALTKQQDIAALRFGIFSFFTAAWGILYSVWTSLDTQPSFVLLIVRTSEVFAVFIPATWIHFVLEFTGRPEPFKNFHRLNYFLALFLAICAPTDLVFSGLHKVTHFHWYKTPGPLFYVWMVIFFVIVIYSFRVLIGAYQQSTGQLRKQLLLLIWGWGISFAVGSTTFFPAFHGDDLIPALLLMPIYPLLVGVSLVRYGLFDCGGINEASQREKLAGLGVLAASFQHEIRNPLFIAKGRIESYLDSAARGIYASQGDSLIAGQKALTTALNHLTRASEILQKMSDFAKPHTSSTLETVLISQSLEEVLKLVAHDCSLEKIKIETEIPSHAKIRISRRQFEEILFNILLNAVHALNHTENPNIVIQVQELREQIQISISDNGPGVSKKIYKKMFQPFSTTKAEKGTGLGLYITKQLVERNNGEINVDSRSGKGTTVNLTFTKPEEKIPVCHFLDDDNNSTLSFEEKIKELSLEVKS